MNENKENKMQKIPFVNVKEIDKQGMKVMCKLKFQGEQTSSFYFHFRIAPNCKSY